VPLRADLASLHRWGFGDPGPLRDELTAAALSGAKTTTASLLADFEIEDEELPEVGQRDILIDSAGQPVAVVETITCRISRLADVDDQHAIDEGEGYADAGDFRVEHERYWNSYIDQVRAKLGDPTFTLGDDTPIVLERFRIVERLDPGEAG